MEKKVKKGLFGFLSKDKQRGQGSSLTTDDLGDLPPPPLPKDTLPPIQNETSMSAEAKPDGNIAVSGLADIETTSGFDAQSKIDTSGLHQDIGLDDKSEYSEDGDDSKDIKDSDSKNSSDIDSKIDDKLNKLLEVKFPSIDSIPSLDTSLKLEKKRISSIGPDPSDSEMISKADGILSSKSDDELLDYIDLDLPSPPPLEKTPEKLQRPQPSELPKFQEMMAKTNEPAAKKIVSAELPGYDALVKVDQIKRFVTSVDKKHKTIKQDINTLKTERAKHQRQERDMKKQVAKLEAATKKNNELISDIKEKEKEYKTHSQRLNKVMRTKEQAEQKIDSMKRKMEMLRAQYADEKKRFTDLEKMIVAKKKSVIEKIKDLEKEEDVLSKEKLKFEKLKTDVDKKLTRFETKEEKFSFMDKNFKAKETELRSLERKLETRKKKIDTAKELKVNITTLKKSKARLEQSINQLEKKEGAILAISELTKRKKRLEFELNRLNDKKTEMMSKYNKYMARVSEFEDVIKQEKTIDEKYKILSHKERELDKMKEEIEEDSFDLEREKISSYAGGETHSYTPRVPVDPAEPKIYRLIKKARQAYHQKDIKTLKGLFEEIRREYQPLRVDREEKTRIYYVIMELKSDIELLISQSRVAV